MTSNSQFLLSILSSQLGTIYVNALSVHGECWQTIIACCLCNHRSSIDNTTWTDAFVTTTGNGGIDDNAFTAKNGRYVRVLCTARGTTYGYSLFDFEVYGS
ncbi:MULTISPECIES: hypothetical protein [unclassified Paenibacillus]|uniref:hypothetical protein n=1 Tax=unclassified Paenibacillus TaxID=185978 RepID=UPI002789C83D|nr:MULTISPECIES: hypothetical protein [unclassified Paenibacillus]MDQ0902107.1 hypothetical protein [Paenibacillus sp. V4I7]MDQ0919399.1 hypothetical protein [Paenibacillus sp. V4I5]